MSKHLLIDYHVSFSLISLDSFQSFILLFFFAFNDERKEISDEIFYVLLSEMKMQVILLVVVSWFSRMVKDSHEFLKKGKQ